METSPPLCSDLSWNFDANVLRRHDRPGPRYTSYPTAPQFHEQFSPADWLSAIDRSNGSGRALSIYIHVPFCTSPCFYCGCNRIITRDASRGERYVDQLIVEAERMAALLDRQREVVQLHFGGGTPNFLSMPQLRRLMTALRACFNFAQRDDNDISIELDPRAITVEDIAQLAAMGFNRASLGVQDFNPQVQLAINRVQSPEHTLDILTACSQNRIPVNVDLIYGLPLQTREGFAQTVRRVLEAGPARLAIYGYAHLPAMFRAQRQIDEAALPSPEDKLALLGEAVEQLTGAGYQYIGLDHFALADDPLARAQRDGKLHRNFMGYTTHADTDLLGLGVSAISRIDNVYAQSPREIARWEARVAAGELAVWRGCELDQDDAVRADLIQRLMCDGHVDVRAFETRHGLDFDVVFSADLERLSLLVDDGLAYRNAARLGATDAGRPLLRLLAMCFDRYLHQGARKGRFSQAL